MANKKKVHAFVDLYLANIERLSKKFLLCLIPTAEGLQVEKYDIDHIKMLKDTKLGKTITRTFDD